MKWYSFKTNRPLDGQHILVWSIDMPKEMQEFIDLGICAITYWNEKENKCQDKDGTLFEVTHWSPFLPPTESKSKLYDFWK